MIDFYYSLWHCHPQRHPAHFPLPEDHVPAPLAAILAYNTTTHPSIKWITREKPKIDRIACPWLIRRFIDPEAEFFFVPYGEIAQKAKELGAIPFDIPEAEFTHYEDRCTFDYFLEKYALKDPASQLQAPIVRGADTDDHSIAGQSAGLWAISAGLAFNTPDDHELLEKGMLLYDALYSWAKYLQKDSMCTRLTYRGSSPNTSTTSPTGNTSASSALKRRLNCWKSRRIPWLKLLT